MYPAPPAPPAPAAPVPSPGGPRRVLLGLTALTLAVLIAAVVIFFVGLPVNGTARANDAAVGRLALANAQLQVVNAPAIKYSGTIESDSNGPLTVNLTVGNFGEATGTVNVATGGFKYLGVAGRSFLQGTSTAWQGLGVGDTVASYRSTRWVEVPDSLFGVNLGALLAPSSLGRYLDPGYGTSEVSAGAPVVAGASSATPYSSGGATTFLAGDPTAAAPAGTTGPALPGVYATPQVVRIKLAGVAAGASRPVTAQLNTDFVDPHEAQQFYDGLPAQLGELNDAINSQFMVNGDSDGSFDPSPCGQGSCTAIYTLSNKVQTTGDVQLPRVVQIDYTVTVALDGKDIKTCKGSVTMPPNGSAPVRCVATYTLSPGSHKITSKLSGQIRALAQVELDRIVTVTKNAGVALGSLPGDKLPGDGHFVVVPQAPSPTVTEYLQRNELLPATTRFAVCPEQGDCGLYNGIAAHESLLDVAVPEVSGDWAKAIPPLIAALPVGYKLRISTPLPANDSQVVQGLQQAGVDLTRVVLRQLT